MTPSPIPAILDGIKTRKDGTLCVVFETAEIPVESKVQLMQDVNKQGYVYFQEAPFSEINIPEVQLSEFDSKKPSQRMRNVIYKIWELSDKSKDFDSYYKITMDKIIEQLKEKLS